MCILGIDDGGLEAVPPAVSGGRAPVQKVRGLPPEAETLLAFGHSMDTANLPCFLRFENLQNQILWLCLPKKKLNRPQFVTVYCELMKSNKRKQYAEIT